MKKIILVITLSLLASSGFAKEKDGIKVGLGIFKYDTSTEGSVVGTGEYSNTIYDLKLGSLSNALYWGFIYSSRTAKSGSGGAEDKRTAMGATLGYHNEGWFLDLSYYLTAERAVGDIKLKDGSGFGFDVGHNRMVGNNLFVGIQATYKSFTYKKVDEVASENKEKSELYPMFNIGFMF